MALTPTNNKDKENFQKDVIKKIFLFGRKGMST